MKAIDYYFLVIILLTGVSACSIEETNYFDQNFVRFSLRVSKTGELDYIRSNAVEVDEYTHSNVNAIKVPILRSTTDLSKELVVNFSAEVRGKFNGITISPKDKLIIPPGSIGDTIVISFNGLWTTEDASSVTLRINSVSDPRVGIGWPRSSKRMDQLVINLQSPKPITISFETNLYEVSGLVNEAFRLPIVFSQEVPKSLLESIEILEAKAEALSTCQSMGQSANYTLIKVPPAEQSNILVYELIFREPLDQNTKLTLRLNGADAGFTNGAITQATLVKGSVLMSSEDPAKNWYDLSDGFFRTYGKAWYKDPTTGKCRWSTFNTFTKPIKLQPNDPNANEDGYHRFRIAFLGNNQPIGTNPFDFRRFYSGASVESPAFSINQAIEFIPDNATGSGTIRIIPQTLQFKTTGKFAVFNIPICGSGAYSYNSAKKRWEMYIEVVSDETELGGPKNVSRYMYIYNNNIDANNPPDLTLPCVLRYDL